MLTQLRFIVDTPLGQVTSKWTPPEEILEDDLQQAISLLSREATSYLTLENEQSNTIILREGILNNSIITVQTREALSR